MPTALLLRDLTAANIDTTRSGNPNGWDFIFQSADGVTTFGDIYDNTNTLTDGSTVGADVALRISVVEDLVTIAIQDFDFITISTTGDGDNYTDLKVWLPTLAVDDILYVDSDGNTWYDEALTQPAGGVQTHDDSVTLSDTLFDATILLSDSMTLSDEVGDYAYEITLNDVMTLADTYSSLVKDLNLYFNDGMTLSDSITLNLEEMTIYFNDTLNLSDAIILDLSGGFTEDSQTDLTWVEV